MIFGRKQIAQLKSDLDASEAREKDLLAEIAKTGVLLTNERRAHNAALATIAEQQDAIELLAKDVAELVPDAEKYRRNVANLRQYRKPVEPQLLPPLN